MANRQLPRYYHKREIKSMVNNQVFGICRDCKRQKHCLSASRGLACNQYISIKAEREQRKKEEQQRILRNLKGENQNETVKT